MKELFEYIFGLKFKKLFLEPTDNGLIKFLRYCFVGGIAFVVDYAGFVVFSLILGDGSFSVAFSTVMGFIFGLITNFVLSKLFVFTEKANTDSTWKEFAAYGVIGVVGCIINVILMLIFVKFINKYISKIIVALIVLIYNYLARKILLYSGGNEQ